MDKVRHRETAEELVQDTFLALHNKSVEFGTPNNLMAFLYVILKNKILDAHRHNLTRRRYSEALTLTFSEVDDTTQALIETRELEKLLHDEVAKLPPQCRKVFILKRQQFMTNKEIADALDISENTVEQHMRKALRYLRVAFLNHDALFLVAYLSPIMALAL